MNREARVMSFRELVRLIRDQVNVLRPQDLDMLFRPKNNVAIAFIEREFDLLFDLSMHDYFTIDYMTTLSRASFKVGRYRKKENDYDLMIDIHKEPEVKFLVEQIKNYVSILNNAKP